MRETFEDAPPGSGPGSRTLVQRCLLGDSRAPGQLLDRYSGRLKGYVRDRLRYVDRAASDESDVAQEAFFKFLMYVKKAPEEVLNDREKLWKCLATIAFRIANKSYAKQEHGPRVVRTGDAPQGENDIADGLPDQGKSPEHFVDIQDAYDQAMALLKDKERTIVELFFVKGLTVTEIARKLGLTREGVYRRLNDVKKRWSTAFGKELS